jgi:ATP-dependent DNA helicase RecG
MGPGPLFAASPFLSQDEGQHFDRRSLFHGPPGKQQSRDRKEVRDQVARYVAGFANAEGGALILGIEDDHTITGHRLPPKALETLLSVPQTRLQPPQPPGFVVAVEGQDLVVFDVPSADSPVQVRGDGFPLRIGDQTIETTESKIRALKFQGLVESCESRPSSLALADLDRSLLARARQGAALQLRMINPSLSMPVASFGIDERVLGEEAFVPWAVWNRCRRCTGVPAADQVRCPALWSRSA